MTGHASGFQAVPPARRFRFGPFEADSRSGELRKHGIKVRLGQQTFQILLMLLEHPDEVVLREDLRAKLWSNDTVVEFDHSINAAIQKLRSALGESAEQSKYIETLPRRGYRFTGTVEVVPAVPVKVESPAVVSEVAEVAATPALATRWKPKLLILATAGVLVALAAFVVARLWQGGVPRQVVSFSLGDLVQQATVSPDGSTIAYGTSRGLVLRRLNSVTEIPVYRNETLADDPAWSPDGSKIVFRTVSGLYRSPAPNGPPALLTQLPYATRGLAVSPDGSVLVSMFSGKPLNGDLYLVPAGGGEARRLEIPGLSAGLFFRPEFLPGGNTILFAWSRNGGSGLGLYLATLEGGKITHGPTLLRRNLTAGHYSAMGGKLLYVQDDKLYAQRLNLAREALEGAPEAVLNEVQTEPINHIARFSISRNGVLVWRAGGNGLAQLTWFDRTGKVLGTSGPLSVPDLVRISPDEKRVLLRTVAEDGGYGVTERNRNGFEPLAGLTANPLWMPRSSHILYCRKVGDDDEMFDHPPDGGVEKVLRACPEGGGMIGVSPDEKVLLYHAGPRLYSLRLDDPKSPPEFLTGAVQASFSPDSRWLVYSQVNDKQIYVQPFPFSSLPTQLTPDGGLNPVWRGDGQEIFYRKGRTIYAVKVHTKGNAFSAEKPEALFDIRIPVGLVGSSMPFDVTRDGSRILFAQGPEIADSKVYVTTDWTAALHR